MFSYGSIVIIGLLSTAAAYPRPGARSNYSAYSFPFVTREEWGARPPVYTTPLRESPVPFVMIHHSYIPPACSSRDTCVGHMQYIQDLHQITNGWEDIGYNFAIGGEGSVYEGRGWENVGSHAIGYNFNSMGIVLIGDWISDIPPEHQLAAVKELIATGVELGYIRPDYKLIGHRQASATECPGQALFDEITTWKHFTDQP